MEADAGSTYGAAAAGRAADAVRAALGVERPAAGIILGSGLGNLEWGLRLRYEVHRKFAPYAGYVWERSFAGTADRRRAEGEPVDEYRFVAGFRMWF